MSTEKIDISTKWVVVDLVCRPMRDGLGEIRFMTEAEAKAFEANSNYWRATKVVVKVETA